MKKILFIANLQNICNFIGQDEYNIGRLVFPFQHCTLWQKTQQHSISVEGKKKIEIYKLEINLW